MRIRRLDPEAPEALRLLRASDAHMDALYPRESNHPEPPAGLRQPGAAFFGAWVGDELAGCGAAKVLEDRDGRYGEIKRVYVADGHRGKGLAKALMARLEAHLKDAGVAVVRLETGVRQPEAIGLYSSLGYVRRGPFGSYAADPLSVFMEKRL